jgi:hypothetical protein
MLLFINKTVQPVKFSQCLISETSRPERIGIGVVEVAPLFITLEQDGGEWSASLPSHFNILGKSSEVP